MVRVIIVGAGAAGLAAAHRLRTSGCRVQVLEARSRVGGRLETRHDFASVPVELGAEFIHGRPPQLLELARRAHVRLGRVPEATLRYRDGKLQSSADDWDAVDEEITRSRPDDQPFSELSKSLVESRKWSAQQAALARRYVEGYMAADAGRISAQALALEERAAAAIHGDVTYRLLQGYDRLLPVLADGLDSATGELRLSTIVHRVKWRRGRVEVRARTATGFNLPPFVADRVVLTQSLGMWKARPGTAGSIRFEPSLPEKQQAARRLAMGSVVKCVLRFRRAFWRDRNQARNLLGKEPGFILSGAHPFRTWWTLAPLKAPVLVGWTGGRAAEPLSSLPEQVVVRRAVASIGSVFGSTRLELEQLLDGYLIGDWQRDPWVRGSYSWVPFGSGDATGTLAKPVAGTLFVAGEATDSGHRGTVHGALESGERAAREVIATL